MLYSILNSHCHNVLVAVKHILKHVLSCTELVLSFKHFHVREVHQKARFYEEFGCWPINSFHANKAGTFCLTEKSCFHRGFFLHIEVLCVENDVHYTFQP